MRFETGAIHVEHKHWTPKTKTALNAHIYCLPLPWHVVNPTIPPKTNPPPKNPNLGQGPPQDRRGSCCTGGGTENQAQEPNLKKFHASGRQCTITFAARRKPKRLSCRWAASVDPAKPRCARGTRAKSARPTAAVTAAISTFEIEVLSRAPGGIGFTTADFTELPESKIQRDNSPSELGSFDMDRGCSPALPLVRTAYHLSDAYMTKCVGYSII